MGIKWFLLNTARLERPVPASSHPIFPRSARLIPQGTYPAHTVAVPIAVGEQSLIFRQAIEVLVADLRLQNFDNPRHSI